MCVWIFSLPNFTMIINIAPNSANPITLLIGLSRNNPLLAISFSLSLLSIAGVPPLAGFLSKFYILVSALQNDMWVVTIIAVISSMISAFYYLQLIKLMWFKDSFEFNYKVLSDISTLSFKNLSLVNSTIISISLYIVLTALINPNPIIVIVNEMIMTSLLV